MQLRVRTGDGVIVVEGWIVLPGTVEADGQFAFGVVLAEEHFRDGGSAFLAGIPGVQQRGHLVEPAMRIHAAAAGEGDDGVRVGCGHGFNQPRPGPMAA